MRKATATSVSELNESFDILEKYFSASKRITAAGDGCREWVQTNAPLREKAVEDDDNLVYKGKVVAGDEA